MSKTILLHGVSHDYEFTSDKGGWTRCGVEFSAPVTSGSDDFDCMTCLADKDIPWTLLIPHMGQVYSDAYELYEVPDVWHRWSRHGNGMTECCEVHQPCDYHKTRQRWLHQA